MGARKVPEFAPPKPELLDGLNMLRAVTAEVFSKDEFKAGLMRAFVKVGLAVDDAGDFVKYTSHARVAMPVMLAPVDSPSEDQFTLANAVVEFETDLRSAFDDAVDELDVEAAQPAAGGAGAGAP